MLFKEKRRKEEGSRETLDEAGWPRAAEVEKWVGWGISHRCRDCRWESGRGERGTGPADQGRCYT